MSEVREFTMPTPFSRRELNTRYREIPLRDTTSRLLRKYCNAAAHLYGVIPLHKLYEIIATQNPTLVTEQEFIAFATIARHECEDYCILGQAELYIDGKETPLMEYEVIDLALICEDFGHYYELFRGQQGKPYYVPKKTEFLAYADPFYWEPTPEALALKQFLLIKTASNAELTEAVFLDLYDDVRQGNSRLQDALERLDDFRIQLKTDRETEKFVNLYTAFHNHTRMQYNRGHTPDEIFHMAPPQDRVPKSMSLGSNIRRMIADGSMDADEMRRQILTMDMPNEALRISLLKELADAVAAPPKSARVGRNAPCPCGSGKKYKYCCGR